VFRGDLYVPDDGSANKAILQRQQLRVPFGLHDLHVQQLDVQVLVHAVKRPGHDDVVLQFDGYFFSDQSLEERVENLPKKRGTQIKQLGSISSGIEPAAIESERHCVEVESNRVDSLASQGKAKQIK